MKKSIICFGLLLLILSSCISEFSDKLNKIEESDFNIKLASPIASGNFSIGELAEELSRQNLDVTTDEDGITTFFYRQPSVFSQHASELFSISNQTFNQKINSGVDLPAGGPGQTLNIQDTYNFDLTSSEGDQMYEIQLKGGTLDLGLSGNLPATGEITLVFTSIIKNNIPVTVNYQWTSDVSQSHSEQIDLTDATIDLTDGSTDFNQFIFNTDLTINYNGKAISSTDGFNIDINLINLDFELLTATFGNRNIAADPSYFKLNFIDEIKHGRYFLEEPALHFDIINSIGAPVNIALNQIVAHSIDKGILPLTGSFLDTPIEIAYPLIPGNKKRTEVSIDETNSNLPEILEFQPDSLEYTFNGIVNPANNSDIHFVTDTSAIKANVLLEVPLKGYIKNVLIAEPYDFDGSVFEDIDNALLSINAENSLPLDAKVQAIFKDENNIILDSLIYDNTTIIPAAQTDENGEVTSSSSESIIVVLNSERLQKISGAQKLVIRALLNTPDSPDQSIIFKEENKLEINLFGQTEFNVEF
ncbi:hypothetical protein E9993_17660 [Labilibacter sediminis]|nr:hypothetical protein E9993_17660 [Labilibacter sediminis]